MKKNFTDPLDIAIAKMNPAGFSSETRDEFQIVENIASNMGMAPSSGGVIVLPGNMRSVITAIGGPVPSDAFFFPQPFDRSVFALLGARLINSGIPGTASYLPNTPFEADENEEASEGAGALTSVSLAAHRLAVLKVVSRTVDIQNSAVIRKLIIDQLGSEMMQQVQRLAFGVQASGSKTYQGFAYKTTSGLLTKKASVVPSASDILNLIAEVDANGCMGENPGFVTNGAGARILMQTPKDTAGNCSLWDKASIFDYPAYETKSVTKEAGIDENSPLLIFGGDWSQLAVVQFGAFDLSIDRFSLARQNKISIVLTGYFDIKGLHGSKATSLDNSTQADTYAYGWASLPIKAS